MILRLPDVALEIGDGYRAKNESSGDGQDAHLGANHLGREASWRPARALQDLREEGAEVAIGEVDKRQAARS